jgi:alanine racemase
MNASKALIHLKRLKNNVGVLRGLLDSSSGGKTRICMPVKSDAYGHGAVPVSKAALEAGVNCLAVAFADEGFELRNAGIEAPIVLLSQIRPQELVEAADAGLEAFIADLEFAKEAAGKLSQRSASSHKRLKVHLKVDSGLGRLGCRPEDAAALAAFISSQACFEYVGTATHFAASDATETESRDYTLEQIRRFNEALDAIRRAGINPGIVHAANTAAVFQYAQAWFDMVRPGIALYGYVKKDLLRPNDAGRLCEVLPVMELVTELTTVKEVKAGESVSYGMTWTAPRDTMIGIIPIGYGDGLRRDLSGKLQVMIGGALYPQVGRICMDVCMVDLGPRPGAKRWDQVVIFGGLPPSPGANDLARLAGTIPYEITCGINKRVQRVYDDGPY